MGKKRPSVMYYVYKLAYLKYNGGELVVIRFYGFIEGMYLPSRNN